jgi:hypothetical protein
VVFGVGCWAFDFEGSLDCCVATTVEVVIGCGIVIATGTVASSSKIEPLIDFLEARFRFSAGLAGVAEATASALFDLRYASKTACSSALNLGGTELAACARGWVVPLLLIGVAG